MHLLAGAVGWIDDGESAVDLAQSPGDIVILSAADSELSVLAGAAAARDSTAPTIRLANLMRLAHPLSVDLYLERTLAEARLVAVRVMGGAGYWSYGLEALRAMARKGGPITVIVPGEDRWDPGLEPFSTAPLEECRLWWRYFVEGGAENAARALAFLAHLIGRGELPEPARVLPRAGAYWPGVGETAVSSVLARVQPGRPLAAVVFYRALVESGSTAPVDALVEDLSGQGLSPLPLFVTSLKDRESATVLAEAFAGTRPAIVLNTTAFAVSGAGRPYQPSVLDLPGNPVLQVVLAGSTEQAWRESERGLQPRDLTMNVVLPEVDGRILTRAVSFKAEHVDLATESVTATYQPVRDRTRFVAAQAAGWVRLAERPAKERRVAIILSNYPNREGRIGNGVGLDTPESAVSLATAMKKAGYLLPGPPTSGAELMALMQSVGARRRVAGDSLAPRLGMPDYLSFFLDLPSTLRIALTDQWGSPEEDPTFRQRAFRLRVHRFGNVVVGVQPSRGYEVDPKATYHDPALVPPHGYLAFYAWLRRVFRADAIVHLGKHGNLEWLPGKALALSDACWPEAILGPTPLIYPFIVNDPGEGSQAKRRTSAVIVDHLMPAMSRAEIHGPLAELEALIDEYYLASGVDARRRDHLRAEIILLAERHGLDRDLGLSRDDSAGALRALDTHLCELKEMQIRDGLHVLGESPTGARRIDTLVAIARAPRSGGRPGDQSLQRAIAADLRMSIDPLDCDAGAEWDGPRPEVLRGVSTGPWRTAGDAVERMENLATAIVERQAPVGPASEAVLQWIVSELAPALDRSGSDEIGAVMTALSGRFVPPGPSGSPTRGRPDVLPTGRNFYSVDVRGIPTAAAWALGRKAADALALRYFQDVGEWPQSIAMSAWGTSNMRTGGDDIAQVLALAGAAPTWDSGTGRVTGYRIMSLSELGRPRIDVTLKISGMFRDAFPIQIDLIDSAMRAVASLDEDAAANPLVSAGVGTRIFGSKPGAYGAGLQALIDTGAWGSRGDLADAFLAWGQFAYGSGAQGEAARDTLIARLKGTDAILHNQDNREHDILDSDDYYQFIGGWSAAVAAAKGEMPRAYHGDHAFAERPRVRPLADEIARVVRGRAANPKWIAGVMRHGYKGAFEIAATVDYLFAFAATTDAVGDHHFDQLYEAYLGDDRVRGFMAGANPAALKEVAARFREAIDRGLWTPRLNSAYDRLSSLIAERREAAE